MEMIYKIEELGEFLLKKVSIIKKQHKGNKFMQHKKNALKLHDKRTDIINAFKNKDNLSGNLEADVYDIREGLEPEPLFEETISERTKVRRQKKSD